MVFAEWQVGEFVWAVLWFTIFFIWIWLLIMVFADIFRSRDMNGWVKALWLLFVIILPFLGILLYLIVRGHGMAARSAAQAQQMQSQLDARIREAAGSSGSPAEQIAQAKSLLDSGAITQAEFDALKAKALQS